MSIHGRPSSTPKTLIPILGRLQPDMASPLSDVMISLPSRMSCGKRGAVRTDHRKKIGIMPRKNCDPTLTLVDPALGDHGCPKCGVEMEPIDIGAEGPPFQQLQLCPGCYLVMWSDQDG